MASFSLPVTFCIQSLGNCGGDLAFDPEDVVQLAVVTFRPQMLVGCGFNQLYVDVHGVTGFLNAAFKDVGHPELPSNLGQITGLALILLSGSPGNYLQCANLCQPH